MQSFPNPDESDTTPPQTAKPLSLADRMKQYESNFDFTLPLDTPIILRLDGHGFSRFTAHFDRPFDQRIHDAMISTCADLLHFFTKATIAYTQSDEITLVFPAGVQSFNERVQKLASLGASYCSVRFNKHLAGCLERMPEPPLKGMGEVEVLGTAYFDARFFAVPSIEEALNNLLWRCRTDAVRNAVSAFARTMYSTKEMHGRRTQELMDMMKEKGVRFEEAVPKWAIEGCLMKREQYEHEGVNLKTGHEEKTLRTRMRVEERGVRVFSEEGLRLVTEKFL
ncbi:Thg1-domain-containing protein [Clathrospora elynae]|uniref:tRNA(His) guanylyltransferase n=1 Tax=Clathrospora elynae TaxID=706981 RepID=A0A6A5T8S9_9PLEO|nr:Thg1-domain-containing protein [Clathrospora elynae]